MSVTLATVADALIEFILSLLHDPDVAAEFDDDPQAALASRGMSGVSAMDVCAVAPVIAEKPHVQPHPAPYHPVKPHPEPHPDPVIKEIKTIQQNFAWVDDRDTIVDQSVNQNIWADGDVTQVFDNEAIVASGDESMAAGDDATVENTLDQSTNMTAGDDVNVQNETTETVVEDSYNEATDASTNTDESTTNVAVESFNDESVTATADESFNDSAAEYNETAVDVEANTVIESEDTIIADDITVDDEF